MIYYIYIIILVKRKNTLVVLIIQKGGVFDSPLGKNRSSKS